MCRNFLQANEDKTKIIVFAAKNERLEVTQHFPSVPESLNQSQKSRDYHGFTFTFRQSH
jgi:hypothetical protein